MLETCRRTILLSILGSLLLAGCGGGSGGGRTVLPEAALSSIALIEVTAVANGQSGIELVVDLKGIGGVSIPNRAVDVRVTGQAIADPASGRSDDAGQFATEIRSTVVEEVVATVTVDLGLGSEFELSSTTLRFEPGAPDRGDSTASVDRLFLADDGNDTATVSVTLVDASGHPIPGATVSLSSTGSGNSIGTADPTDAQGRTSLSFRSTVAEAKLLSILATTDQGTVELEDPLGVLVSERPRASAYARFEDRDFDGAIGADDRLVLPFSSVVSIGEVEESDLHLPVSGDSFGASPSIGAGDTMLELAVTLGAGASLRSRQNYSGSDVDAGSPSGLDIVGTPLESITDVFTGLAAEQSAPRDLIPGLVADGSLGSAQARAIVAGDLDADGDLDLVLGFDDQGNEVLLNDGAASFSLASTLGSEATHALVLADLDGDGDLDLAEGVDAAADRIWWNDGSGGFSDSGQRLGSSSTRALVAADLDADGDLDLVAAHASDADAVYLNAAGTFSDSGQSLGSGTSNAVHACDLDGDGDLDLVMGTPLSTSNPSYTNDGSAVFSNGVQSFGNADVRAIASADVDGDGHRDLALGVATGPDEIHRGDGEGAFTVVPEDAIFTTDTSALVFCDFDADGDLDLFKGKSNGADVIHVNEGGGEFVDSGMSLAAASTQAIAVFDADGDGDEDLATAGLGSSLLWRGSRSGSWGNTQFSAGQSLSFGNHERFTAGDVDGDGDVDVFVPDRGADEGVLLRNTDGVFARETTAAPAGFLSLLADLDGDLDLDLLVIDTSLDLVLYLNDGTGAFSDSGTSFGTTNFVAVGDVDADGDPDLVRIGIGSLNVHLNDGSGSFSAGDSELITGAVSVGLGDLDRDGDLDAVVGISADGPAIYSNDGAGDFSDSGQDLDGNQGLQVRFGDLDRDGDLDFVIADQDGDDVHLNSGGGTFPTAGGELGGTGLTYDVALADLDCDGDLDALHGTTSAPYDLVYWNDGSASFSAGLTLASFVSFFQVADFDRDGDLDILVSVGADLVLYESD